MARISLDSGVLIALERRDAGAWAWLRRASERGVPPLVSAVAVAESWRGDRGSWLGRALRGCDIVPVTDELARAAGVALAKMKAAQATDAIIAATAAAEGAVLITADAGDMHALAGHFRSLRVVAL